MLKLIPITIIIVLTFILIFSATNLTIWAATNLPGSCLLLLLISQLCILCYGLVHKQIYTMLIPGLITLGLLYTLYIKQIYIREAEIIQDLKDKDIIEKTVII
jgi:type III secretory pathway component EscU